METFPALAPKGRSKKKYEELAYFLCGAQKISKLEKKKCIFFLLLIFSEDGENKPESKAAPHYNLLIPSLLERSCYICYVCYYTN